MGFTGYGTAQAYEVCAQPALACFIIRTARFSTTDRKERGGRGGSRSGALYYSYRKVLQH
jgi:hypothetical protein